MRSVPSQLNFDEVKRGYSSHKNDWITFGTKSSLAVRDLQFLREEFSENLKSYKGVEGIGDCLPS